MSRFVTLPEQLPLRYSHISVSFSALFHKDLYFKTASRWNLQKQLLNGIAADDAAAGGDYVGSITKNNTLGLKLTIFTTMAVSTMAYDVRFPQKTTAKKHCRS